ncbi:MAG: glycosyltransferase family 9 protein [Candidatus Kapaibacteriota bacterium]
MGISFLKPLERSIRRLLIQPNRKFKGILIESTEQSIPLNPNPRILIIRPDKLGDMLITLPTIKAIRDAYPHARIDILAGKVNLPLKDQLLLYADNVLLYDKTLKSIFTLIRNLPSYKYDIAIDPLDNPSTTSGFLMKLSGAKHRIGIVKSNSHVYTHCVVAKDRATIHIVERAAQVLLGLGINPEHISLSIPYHIDEQIRKSSLLALKNVGIDLSRSLIMINIAGALQDRILEPISAIPWIQTIKQTLSNHDVQLMICGERKHEKNLRFIADSTGILLAPFVNSYQQFAGLLAGSSMLISPDTSVLHLISAFKIPCLAFFVQDNSGTKLWTPYQSPHEYIITKGPTVNAIPADEIIKAFNSLFSITTLHSVDHQLEKNGQ